MLVYISTLWTLEKEQIYEGELSTCGTFPVQSSNFNQGYYIVIKNRQFN